jgi:hypothetical protein
VRVTDNVTDVVTGVSTAGGVIIRGQSPANTLLLLDGIDMPLVMHLGGIRTVVPLSLLEGASYFPGNFPGEYGRATAGLLELRTARELPTRWTGHVDLNSADVGAVVRAPLGDKMSLAFGGTFSILDRVLYASIPSGAQITLAPLPRYWDAQAQWLFNPSPKVKLSALLLTSSDRLVDWFGATPGAITVQDQFHRGLLTAQWLPSATFDTTLTVGLGYDHFVNTAYDISEGKLQAQARARWKAASSFTLDFGLDHRLERLFGTVQRAGLPTNATIPDAELGLTPQNGHTSAAWATGTWKPTERLDLIPSFRAEYHSLVKQAVADPRAFARLAIVQPSDSGLALAVKAGAGLYHRPPSMLQTNPQLGTSTLTTEEAVHAMAGFELQTPTKLTIDVSGFYVSQSSGVTAGSAPAVFDNTGIGHSYGAEIFLQQQLWNHLEGWLSYTVARSESGTTADTTTPISGYDQTHVVALWLAYGLPLGFKASVRWQYASGNPTTAIIGSIFNSTTNQYQPIVGTTLDDRLPAYHQLDVRLARRWQLPGWNLTAYVEVRNVYNQANAAEPATYGYDYLSQNARSALPIFPVAGVSGDF